MAKSMLLTLLFSLSTLHAQKTVGNFYEFATGIVNAETSSDVMKKYNTMNSFFHDEAIRRLDWIKEKTGKRHVSKFFTYEDARLISLGYHMYELKHPGIFYYL